MFNRSWFLLSLLLIYWCVGKRERKRIITYWHLVHVKKIVCPSSADLNCSVAYDIVSLLHLLHFRSTIGPSAISVLSFCFSFSTVLKWIVYSALISSNTARKRLKWLEVSGYKILNAQGPHSIDLYPLNLFKNRTSGPNSNGCCSDIKKKWKMEKSKLVAFR